MMLTQMNALNISQQNITDMAGNKYFNGISMGFAELAAMPASAFMLSYWLDTSTYKISALIAIMSSLSLLVVSRWFLAVEIGVFLQILGIGGMMNCIFLITEMRVEASRVGSVMLLIMTIS